jgi:DNA-directed RNA polymerase subunit RPC12/RpoP
MRNRYAGICEKCKKEVPPKKGRWRLIPKIVQNFTGLRCMKCSTTTKKALKALTAHQQ